MEGILKKLQTLSESDFYPYHMPGHKRLGNEAFALDITEIDEFDNLHHATGMLRDAQNRAAKLYGAKESFFLVNGSTCGLLSAVFASFNRGDKVLVARNCHKAVYHALEIRGLEPIYLYPKMDGFYDINVGITISEVKERIDEYQKNNHKQISDAGKVIKGMILTSPTYEGLTSEIKEIAEFLHSRDMLLIVDEAHGAHFGFGDGFPQSAVTQGADLVIQSMHKTLPSMTQTALLHRCSDRVDTERIQKYLGVFQTSSPSYVFMAYMDECIRLLEGKGAELFRLFRHRLDVFYKRCEAFQCIKVRKPSIGDDPGKIVIYAEGFSGKELYEILRNRYHLQPEMCAGNYVLAIMTVCDSEEGFQRLYEALAELNEEFTAKSGMRDQSEVKNTGLEVQETLASLLQLQAVQRFYPYETEGRSRRQIKLKEAAGRVSGEYIYLYPPGIPFIVPGEILDEEMVEGLLFLQKSGYELQGMTDVSGESLKVLL